MKKIIIMMTFATLMGCSKTETLFEEAQPYTHKKVDFEAIENLPKPVKAYFHYALEENQEYVNYLRLKHSGTFKLGKDKDWMDIEGKQYFRTNPPGFVWEGKNRMFKARDSYVEQKGNLSVYLFGFLRIIKSEGAHVDQAELLRWLGESVWMPTNLLPDENKQWKAIDDTSARIELSYEGLNVYYDVYFNEQNQITRLETQRYMEKDKLENWVGEVSNYQKVNGMMVPADIEASWMLEDGKYTYARFHVEEFDYNNPDKY